MPAPSAESRPADAARPGPAARPAARPAGDGDRQTGRPNRATPVALGLVLAAGVLVMDPAGWSPFGPAKWTAVVLVGLAAIALTLGTRPRLTFIRWASAAWVVFLVWVCLAAGRGLDPHLAWTGSPQRHFGALTWMLCAALFWAGHTVDGRRSGRLLAGVAATTGGLAGLWSVAELAGWEPVSLASSSRLVGPLGSAAYLGAAEALLVPIAVGLAADRTLRPAPRRLAVAAAALGTVALVGSGARAAWVGVLVASAVVAWIRRGALRRRVTARKAGVLAVAAFGVAAVAGLAVMTGTAGRIPDAFHSSDPGGQSRLAEWEVAGRVLVAHPLTGVGPEGYRIAFGSAVSAGYQRRYGRDPLPDRAHDSLLDVGVTTGIPGLVTYVALLGLVGIQVRRAIRQAGQTRPRPWLAGVGAGLLAYATASLFLFPLAEVEPGAWALAGMLSVQLARPDELIAVDLPRAGRLIAQTALGAALAWAAFVGVRSVAADRAVKTALADTARGEPAPALRAAASAVDRAPGDIVVRLAAAQTDASLGTRAGIDAALTQIHAALRTSPHDPVLGDELGTLLVQQARLTGTPADWRAASAELLALRAADPRNPAVLLQLGVAQASLGDYGTATATLEEAAFLDPSSNAPAVDLDLVRRMAGLDGTG